MADKRWALALALPLALGGCAGGGDEQPAQTALERAYDICAAGTEALVLDDDGRSISARDILRDSVDRQAVYCIQDEIGSSEALATLMGSTTQSMGRQTMDDGDFTWIWSFNETTGTTVVVQEK